MRQFKVCVATALMAAAFTASSVEARELKAAIGLGPKHPVVAAAYPAFASEVERLTNKSLTVKVFPGGVLLPLRGALPGLRDNVADLATLIFTYYPAELRTAQVVGELANLGKSNSAMSGATAEFIFLHCPACQAEFSAQRTVVLSPYGVTPYVILSKTKVTTLAEIAGKKIRSGGGFYSNWAKFVGATDVNIPVDEMYEAFNAGVIDAGVQTEAGLRAYNFWDTVKHVTQIPLGIFSAASIFSASQTMWQSLTADERKAMLRGASAGLVAQIKAYDEDVSSVIEPAKQRGVQFYQPAPDLIAKTAEFDDITIRDVTKLLAEKYNVVDAEKLVATYKELIVKWTRLTKPIETDYPALLALFNREVYDKVDANKVGM